MTADIFKMTFEFDGMVVDFSQKDGTRALISHNDDKIALGGGKGQIYYSSDFTFFMRRAKILMKG